ncbi:hypothetical protein [Hymenobacter norwichensis]|uniref:hypothetical protein n=1 Tax=Hymenobacter norwichensis TaxID=223903 RepID=UPI0003B38471|nr:hypothetical protein [Hymenobacter norwichensis]
MILKESAWWSLSQFIKFTAQLSLLLPLWIGYQRWNYLKQEYKPIFWCCVMWAVLTVVGEILFAAKLLNLYIWNLVTVLETLLIGYAFYLALPSSKIRFFVRLAAWIFMVTAFADYFFISGLRATTTYTVALETVLLVTLVLLYFERSLHDLRTTPLERHPMFVIGIGVITYFAGTVMVFLLQNSVHGVQKLLMMLINFVLSFILNSIIARAFWLAGREPLHELNSSKAYKREAL